MTVFDDGIGAWRDLEQCLRARWPAPPADASFAEHRDHARRIADTLAGAMSDVPSPRCRIVESPIDGAAAPDAPRAAFVRIYEPFDHDGVLPTQLFLHGGGFCFGSSRELVNDSVLAARTVATGIRHVSLEYALAPEHPFPDARDQTLRVLAELHSRASQLGIDASRLGLGGNSAGASIVASAALELQRRRERGEDAPLLHHLFLEVPAVSLRALGGAGTVTDRSAAPAAETGSTELTADLAAEFQQLLEQYRPAPDGSAFIADADQLPPFPPTLILAAEHDPLTEGAALLARRLREGDSAVQLHTVPGTFHGSPGITRTSPAAQRWQQFVDEELRAAYDTDPSAFAARSENEGR